VLPPVYRAEVLLAPVTEEKSEGLGALASQFGDLAALAGVNLGTRKDKTAEYVAALKSRALSVSYIKEANLMPILFASKWSSEKKQWKDSDNRPTEWDAFKLWDEDIRRVNFDRRAGLVTLMIEWTDPALAAKWANELVMQVNKQLRTEAVEEAQKSVAYLEKQLSLTSSVEVQQAIYRLIEAQTKKQMVASTREEYAFQTIDPAVPPQEKASPKRALIVITALMFGLVLGVLAAWWMRLQEGRGKGGSAKELL
jgi:LPS O-antigen subunit length determinant protein (WzzB/FepE family)